MSELSREDVLSQLPGEFWVRDVGALKAMADPLRVSIIRALYRWDEEWGCVPGRTIREVCVLLGEERTTRVYHHFKVLLEAGLIRKVGVVRRGNVSEDRFGPVARSVLLDPDFLRGVRLGHGGESWLETALAVLETVRVDVEGLGGDVLASRVFCMHRELRVRGDRLEAMQEELRGVLERYAEGVVEGEEDGVRVLMMVYPARVVGSSE